MKKNILLLFFLLSAILPLAAGCGTVREKAEQTKEDLSLSIGLMPAVDAAPVLLADRKGYFKELGLNMDLQVYTNAVNRQSALQSGKLDGTMTDLVAFLNNRQNGFDIRITTSTEGTFPFLVRKDFAEKEKVSVGTMEISVTNFLTDEYLGKKYKLEKVFIDEIPARMEMVKAGKLDMAIVPEPVASMGELDGLEKRIYGDKDGLVPDVIVFTGKAVKEKEKAVQLFHKAYNKAVEDMKKDQGVAREVLIEKLNLNPQIKDRMTLPEYHKARVPEEAYIKNVTAWVESVQKTKITVNYQDMVERKFSRE